MKRLDEFPIGRRDEDPLVIPTPGAWMTPRQRSGAFKKHASRAEFVRAYLELAEPPQQSAGGITVQDLARHAGVAAKTFYANFGDVQGLRHYAFDSLVHEASQEAVRRVADGRSAPSKTLVAYLAEVALARARLRGREGTPPLGDKPLLITTLIVRAAQVDRSIRHDVLAEELAEIVLGAVPDGSTTDPFAARIQERWTLLVSGLGAGGPSRSATPAPSRRRLVRHGTYADARSVLASGVSTTTTRAARAYDLERRGVLSEQERDRSLFLAAGDLVEALVLDIRCLHLVLTT